MPSPVVPDSPSTKIFAGILRPCETNACDRHLFVFSHELTQDGHDFLDHSLGRGPAQNYPVNRGSKMSALTGPGPKSTPMLSRTVTGFAVPAKLAFNAAASTANCLPPVRWMTTSMLTPLIMPMNVYVPKGLCVKEPGGIAAVKLPIWSVTGSATGLIPSLALPRVKLARSPKASWFGFWSRSIASFALNALKGMHCDGGPMATASGLLPTRIVATTALVAVAMTETELGPFAT